MDHAHHAPYRACLAPGPGHAGQSAVGARVPENSWGHRRSWRRRTVPQYRGCTPTPTSQITEAEVFDWWERYHLRHEGYETIAGDPTRQAAVRIAVSRLAHALDRPLRKGRPGRPRTRQIGRSDAEFLRKSRDAFVLFFSPLRAASIGTGRHETGTQRGTVKLAESESIDPQDTGPEPVVNPPCWASETAVGLNLTIPGRVLRSPFWSDRDSQNPQDSMTPLTKEPERPAHVANILSRRANARGVA